MLSAAQLVPPRVGGEKESSGVQGDNAHARGLVSLDMLCRSSRSDSRPLMSSTERYVICPIAVASL